MHHDASKVLCTWCLTGSSKYIWYWFNFPLQSMWQTKLPPSLSNTPEGHWSFWELQIAHIFSPFPSSLVDFFNIVPWLQWHCTIMLFFPPPCPVLGPLPPIIKPKQNTKNPTTTKLWALLEWHPCFWYPSSLSVRPLLADLISWCSFMTIFV